MWALCLILAATRIAANEDCAEVLKDRHATLVDNDRRVSCHDSALRSLGILLPQRVIDSGVPSELREGSVQKLKSEVERTGNQVFVVSVADDWNDLGAKGGSHSFVIEAMSKEEIRIYQAVAQQYDLWEWTAPKPQLDGTGDEDRKRIIDEHNTKVVGEKNKATWLPDGFKRIEGKKNLERFWHVLSVMQGDRGPAEEIERTEQIFWCELSLSLSHCNDNTCSNFYPPDNGRVKWVKYPYGGRNTCSRENKLPLPISDIKLLDTSFVKKFLGYQLLGLSDKTLIPNEEVPVAIRNPNWHSRMSRWCEINDDEIEIEHADLCPTIMLKYVFPQACVGWKVKLVNSVATPWTHELTCVHGKTAIVEREDVCPECCKFDPQYFGGRGRCARKGENEEGSKCNDLLCGTICAKGANEECVRKPDRPRFKQLPLNKHPHLALSP